MIKIILIAAAIILLLFIAEKIRIYLFLQLAITRSDNFLKSELGNKLYRIHRERHKQKNPYTGEVNQDIIWMEGQETKEITIKSFDGLLLTGHYLQAKENIKEKTIFKESQRTIVMMHGWRGNWKKDLAGIAKVFHEKGYHLLMAEQRAHGKSEGKYLGFGCLERFDCHTWVEYLVQQEENLESEIYLAGISMGAATVLMAAGDPFPAQVKGIIADSGYTNPYDMVCHFGKSMLHINEKNAVPRINNLCIKKAGYDLKSYSTLEAMKKCTLPVFFTHSTGDDFVPHSFTLENYEECAAKKTLYLVSEVGHCMGFYKDKEQYMKALSSFFQWNQEEKQLA
ncbi:alpha/beta hydrolase [Lachnospiraceae bacterium OttesenSCG-928-D06]|nr:alpha/beta hydrolase [Lachnospiraceae bacterium OttesenSCG-928-D06]